MTSTPDSEDIKVNRSTGGELREALKAFPDDYEVWTHHGDGLRGVGADVTADQAKRRVVLP
jgi:hypothetical protein